MTTKTGVVPLGDIKGLFGRPSNNSVEDAAIPSQTRRAGTRLHGVEAVLEAALDVFEAPAFLISRAGDVVLTSAKVRELDAHELALTLRSLVGPLAKGLGDETWELRPLYAEGGSSGFLAVLRARPKDTGDSDPNAKAKRHWKLTGRQGQVLDLIARGYTNALIAETLGISEGTVEFHLTAVFDKAGVSNRTTLIVKLFAVLGS